MAINQLFKIKPSFEILLKICFLYGIDLNNLEKKNTFTKMELIELQIENYFEIIQELLEQYYLPCKNKKYLECINIKKCITILRQLLKLYNYLFSDRLSTRILFSVNVFILRLLSFNSLFTLFNCVLNIDSSISIICL